MPNECSVNCLDNPDSVDKINWKCVECGANLKDPIKEKFAERKTQAKEDEKLAAEKEKGQLTEAEKDHRRSMGK